MELEKLPENATFDGVVQGKLRNEGKRIDRGWIGGIFGGVENVPANVASVIAVIMSVSIVIIVFNNLGSDQFTVKDGITSLSGILTLVAGFLFGRSSRS